MNDPLLFWSGPDPLAPHAECFAREAFETAARERVDRLFRPHWEPLHDLLRQLPGGTFRRHDGPAVGVGEAGETAPVPPGLLEQAARRLMPWRKGPFRLFDLAIDAEWRSDRKWERLAPHLGSLTGKTVCDLGCGNGYYLFRALAQEPAWALGLDPSEIFFHQFHLVQRFLRAPSLRFEMLGAEHLPFFPGLFDRVLCLGIIYHQRDPLALLGGLRDALRPGGLAVVESMGIPGDGVAALTPPGRYAKARNVYQVPSLAALAQWMEQAGFVDVKQVSSVPTTPAEQRATDWMVFESLSDFLDPDDSSRTVEGHPAPLRIAVTGRRP